jgi:hypothetical protein
VIRHQFRFAEPDLRHVLDDFIDIVGLPETVGDGADLHAAKLGIHTCQTFRQWHGGQGDFAEISSCIKHDDPFVRRLNYMLGVALSADVTRSRDVQSLQQKKRADHGFSHDLPA